MTDLRTRVPAPVGLGFVSHLLAGVLPFFSSGALTRLGLMPGTATLYVAGAVVLTLTLAKHSVRSLLRTETTALLATSAFPFLVGLAGFLIAGVAYYVGLARTPRVAEYIFLTRLDWLVQAAVAIVWLRESWTFAGLAGAALALAGGLMLAWSGAFGASGLLAAAVYILASLAGYSCFKPLSTARGPRGALALTMWRHWINTAGFVGLATVMAGPPDLADTRGLMLAGVAGVVLVVLFLLRFTALTGIPLWVLSAQAPTQALVAIAVTLATGGTIGPGPIAAIALIAVGEVLVTRSKEAAR